MLFIPISHIRDEIVIVDFLIRTLGLAKRCLIAIYGNYNSESLML